MNLIQPFVIAGGVPYFSEPFDQGEDYLIVTGRDPADPKNKGFENGDNVFKHALGPGVDADEMLNRITKWMRSENVMDQREIHGDDKSRYNISFYHASSHDPNHPSLVGKFELKDYLFSGCQLTPGTGFDDFMRMLDRDRLADDMRESLKNSGIPTRENAPLFWRSYIRACSHPDHRRPAFAATIDGDVPAFA